MLLLTDAKDSNIINKENEKMDELVNIKVSKMEKNIEDDLANGNNVNDDDAKSKKSNTSVDITEDNKKETSDLELKAHFLKFYYLNYFEKNHKITIRVG